MRNPTLEFTSFRVTCSEEIVGKSYKMASEMVGCVSFDSVEILQFRYESVS